MTTFFRFPSTPYLVAPRGLDVRADKVLSAEERAQLLDRTLRVEEKVDGQNLGISSNGDGLLFQSRGSYIELGGRHFQGLESWVKPRAARIDEALGTQLVLFGEWMAITHSVRYDRLPDWFLAFDVFDRDTGEFWPAAMRDELAAELGLATTPLIAEGRFTLEELIDLTEARSGFGRETMEGVVLRAVGPGSSPARAKLVRPDFVQQIEEHWTKGPQRRNRLLGV